MEWVKNNWHGVSGRNGLWMVLGAVLTFVAVPDAGPGRGTGTGWEGRWLINSVLPKYDVPIRNHIARAARAGGTELPGKSVFRVEDGVEKEGVAGNGLAG